MKKSNVSRILGFVAAACLLWVSSLSSYKANAQDIVTTQFRAGVGWNNQFLSGSDADFTTTIDGRQTGEIVGNLSPFKEGASNLSMGFNIGGGFEIAIPTTSINLVGLASYRNRGFDRVVNTTLRPSATPDQAVEIATTFQGMNHYLGVEGQGRYYFNKTIFKPYVSAGLRADAKLFTTTEVKYSGGNFEAAARESIENEFRNRLNSFNGIVLGGVLNAGVKIWKIGIEAEWNPDLTSAFNERDGRRFNATNSLIGVNLTFDLVGL